MPPRPRHPRPPTPAARGVKERNRLVEQWAALVPWVLIRLRHDPLVRRYRHDCESAAYLALLRAAELWREGGGAAFNTYAVVSIRRRVMQAAARQARLRARDVPFLPREANRAAAERHRARPRPAEPEGAGPASRGAGRSAAPAAGRRRTALRPGRRRPAHAARGRRSARRWRVPGAAVGNRGAPPADLRSPSAQPPGQGGQEAPLT